MQKFLFQAKRKVKSDDHTTGLIISAVKEVLTERHISQQAQKPFRAYL
jgi:hypothetical protein